MGWVGFHGKFFWERELCLEGDVGETEKVLRKREGAKMCVWVGLVLIFLSWT